MIRLKEMREKRKLTQTQLSAISGISQQLICMIENGQRANPTIDTLFRLSTALKCSVDDLYIPD